MANAKLARDCEVGQRFPVSLDDGGTRIDTLTRIIIPTWRTHPLEWWLGRIGFEYDDGDYAHWWYPNDNITVE